MKLPQPTTPRRPRAGLSTLLGMPTPPLEKEQGLQIPLSRIHRNPAQPRTVFSKDTIDALSESIKQKGVIQPIAVRCKADNTYEIIAGERRWLAAKQAGLDKIPAVIHDADEHELLLLALVENLVREDLSPLENARAYASLQDQFGMSITDIAKAVGRSRPSVSNTLRLLELPDSVLDLLRQNKLSEGHGRALLGCTDRLAVQKLAHLTINKRLSVRQLEQAVRSHEEVNTEGQVKPYVTRVKWNLSPDPEIIERAENLSRCIPSMRTKVKVGNTGAKLELQFDHINNLLALLEQLETALGLNSGQQQKVGSAA